MGEDPPGLEVPDATTRVGVVSTEEGAGRSGGASADPPGDGGGVQGAGASAEPSGDAGGTQRPGPGGAADDEDSASSAVVPPEGNRRPRARRARTGRCTARVAPATGARRRGRGLLREARGGGAFSAIVYTVSDGAQI